MSAKQTQTKTYDRMPNNSSINPVISTGMDFSNAKRMKRHMVRDGNGIKIVEDGIVDEDALIQSEACNAGLQNIIRLQTMRYVTIDNAIARNKDKQVFADVSKIPTSIAEQQEYVASVQADVDALCAKLGISKEELLKANQEFLASKLQAVNTPSGETAVANEGGQQ